MVNTDGNENAIKKFRITGITCLDCAQKFEQAVRERPGVVRVSLNTMTGVMEVEGKILLNDIQSMGKSEGYSVSNLKDAEETKDIKTNIARYRMIFSGLSLAGAYAAESLGMGAWVYLSMYVAATLAGGWGNFRKAINALPRGNFNMSVLMGVAVIGAFIIGQYEEGAAVAFLYSVSEMLETWTMEKARRSLQEVIDMAPKSARVRSGSCELNMAVAEIAVGDIVIVHPGEKIAMDGIIIKGRSAINQSAITGESMPTEKNVGDEVFAGTFNTNGTLEFEVTKRVEDTALAKIIHMVETAQTKRAPRQVLIERFAAVYTPIVLVLAIGIVIVPPLLMGYAWTEWVYRGLALLVVSCPCALVISTPVAIVTAISVAAQKGVLIKGGIHLEEIGGIKAMAFDKTGTLTKGVPVITDIVALNTVSENELLGVAAGLEMRSEHPLGAAIVKAAKERNLNPIPVEDFYAMAGQGVQGKIGSETIYIGNRRFFDGLGISTELINSQLNELQTAGKTVMIIGAKKELKGIIAVADEVRDESVGIIEESKRVGVRHTIMLTGDNEATARQIAMKLGFDEFHANLLPADKVAAIEDLLRRYGKVAMVGDGINDAPAMALSTVGIAMGGAGTDTALETADIALMADDLSKLGFVVRISKKTMAIIRQNITFAIGIKLIAVLAVFPGWLTLWLAILADMGATIIVTLNSLRILNFNNTAQR